MSVESLNRAAVDWHPTALLNRDKDDDTRKVRLCGGTHPSHLAFPRVVGDTEPDEHETA